MHNMGMDKKTHFSDDITLVCVDLRGREREYVSLAEFNPDTKMAGSDVKMIDPSWGKRVIVVDRIGGKALALGDGNLGMVFNILNWRILSELWEPDQIKRLQRCDIIARVRELTREDYKDVSGVKYSEEEVRACNNLSAAKLDRRNRVTFGDVVLVANKVREIWRIKRKGAVVTEVQAKQ